MRDANTQIYRFVIRDPPPREADEPVSDEAVEALPGPESEPGSESGSSGTTAALRRPTPGKLATSRRPLPPSRRPTSSRRSERLLIAAGLLIGLGVGGSIDGSAFHQLVQYHAGGTPAGLVVVKTDPLWDGLLHAGTWLGSLVGLGLLWRVVRRAEAPLRTSTFVGSLLLGWGVYNVGEGALDHRLLQAQQVHPVTAQLLWDGGLIGSGVILTLLGALCIGFERRRRPAA